MFNFSTLMAAINTVNGEFTWQGMGEKLGLTHDDVEMELLSEALWVLVSDETLVYDEDREVFAR